MQCQDCNEHTATIHLTEINDGQRVETHLCELCAQKQGLAVKNQIPLNELLSSLIASQSSSDAPATGEEEQVEDITCPHCGMTLSKFRKTSLLGCPQDYDVFDKSLQLLISKSQAGKTTHCGKIPSRQPEDTKKHLEMMDLRHQLETAIKDEDYEAAAKLRDQIEKPE